MPSSKSSSQLSVCSSGCWSTNGPGIANGVAFFELVEGAAFRVRFDDDDVCEETDADRESEAGSSANEGSLGDPSGECGAPSVVEFRRGAGCFAGREGALCYRSGKEDRGHKTTESVV